MLKHKNFIIFIFLILINISNLFSQENTYIIEGKIRFKGKGKIYIILVNENTFSLKTEGINKMIFSPSFLEEQSGEISFTFKNVKSGIYGIKCFLSLRRFMTRIAGLHVTVHAVQFRTVIRDSGERFQTPVFLIIPIRHASYRVMKTFEEKAIFITR